MEKNVIYYQRKCVYLGPYAGPACMPDAVDDFRGATDCFLSGWGFVEKNGNTEGTRADQLQKVGSRIVIVKPRCIGSLKIN